MTNFHACEYGPLSLRPFLRRWLEEDERVIAWGTTDPKPRSADILGAILQFFVPMLGWFLLWALTGEEEHWLLVLTNERLLVLDSSGPPGVGRAALRRGTAMAPRQIRIEDLHVRRNLETGEFEIRSRGAEEAFRFFVPEQESPAARRLRDALGRLVEIDADAGVADDDDVIPPDHRLPPPDAP